MSSSESGELVDSLVLQFGDLQIGITVRNTGSATSESHRLQVVSGAASDFSLVSGEATHASALPLADSTVVTSELEQAAISATTSPELAALDLGFLSHYRTRLRGSNPEWSGAAHIGRAFRAGVVARLRLLGEYRREVSVGIPFRNQYYIALRGFEGGPAFWTTSYGVFCARTCAPGRNDFDQSSVCHAFPSHAECCAYLAGAQQGWPQEAR